MISQVFLAFIFCNYVGGICSFAIRVTIKKCLPLQSELINNIKGSHRIFKNFAFVPIIKEQDKLLFKRGHYMKFTLKNRLFVSFAVGFCFIVFNSIGFAGESGGIQKKEHSGLESPETANKHEKESLSNQSVLKGQRYLYRY